MCAGARGSLPLFPLPMGAVAERSEAGEGRRRKALSVSSADSSPKGRAKGLRRKAKPEGEARKGGCRANRCLIIRRASARSPSFHTFCFFMLREMRFLPLSTASTVTSAASPTFTSSLGCLTKRSASSEICTRPS